MKFKNKSLFWLVALLVIIALVSTACGAAAPDTSAELEAAQKAAAEAEQMAAEAEAAKAEAEAALAEAEGASAEELAEAQAAVEAAQAETEAAQAEAEAAMAEAEAAKAEAAVPEEEAEGPVTLTFWSRDTNQVQLRALVDAWNETHETQIELTLAPFLEFASKLGVAMAAGTPPDLAAIEVTAFPKFSSQGQVLDITDKARALPYFDHLIGGHTASATYPKVGGRVYGISFFPDNAVLVYNKDLFEQAGLDPENPPLSTRAEMKDAIERITALGDDIYGFYFSGACQGCSMFLMLSQIWASGGDVLNEDATAATFDDPEVAAFYEFYRELWTSGQVPPSAEADTGSGWLTLFQAGKIGMQGTNSPGVAGLINDFPELNFGVAYLPGREGGVGSFVGGDVISITADSKHPDEAWEFLEWMTSEEVQLKYYAGMNMIPIRTDLYDPEKIQFSRKIRVLRRRPRQRNLARSHG